MKLLFLLPNIGYGGASKILVFLANELAKIKLYAVTILVYKNDNILQEINHDVQIQCIKDKYNKKIIRHLQYLFAIYKKVKIIKPDIIISFLNYPNIYSVIVGKLLSIPVIISERGDPYQRKKTFDRLFDIIYNTADGAVFQTEGAKLYFHKKLQKKSAVIPNPIINDLKNKYTPNNSHRIAFVGRFEIKQKRQDVMLKAFQHVLEIYPDSMLHFYGDGQDEIIAKNIAKELGINESVIFHGYTKNPTNEIFKSEVYVLTSDYEGIPNSLIEAMKLGMPVISTDCSPGGAKLLIRNNENGIIVKCGDILGISEAIIKIFASESLKYKLSTNASKIDKLFPSDKIINSWDNYIKSVYNAYNK